MSVGELEENPIPFKNLWSFSARWRISRGDVTHVRVAVGIIDT